MGNTTVDQNFGFTFVPGTATPNAAPVPSDLFNMAKRGLTLDEYQYYYIKLDDQTLSTPTRIALAICLQADLVRLYKNTPAYQQDVFLKGWTDLYPQLADSDKAQCNGEIFSFFKFLNTTKAADFYPPNVLPYLDSAEAFQQAANDAAVAQEAQLTVLKANVQKQQQDQVQAVTDKVKEVLSTFDEDEQKRITDFMNTQLPTYLTSMKQDEYDAVLNTAYQKQQSDIAYADILKRYKAGEFNYQTAISLYKQALDQISTMKIVETAYTHPMMKYVSTKVPERPSGSQTTPANGGLSGPKVTQA